MKNKKLTRIIRNSLIVFILLIPAATLLTRYLYRVLEGKRISLAQSLVFVMQTITTTGYGELLPFETSAMNIYAIALMLIGLGLIFLVLSTAATQWLHEHFEERSPQSADPSLKDHVILCGYNPMTMSLLEELGHHELEYIVIEKDNEIVRDLLYKEIPVILGDPTERDVLLSAGIKKAHSLVASVSDDLNVKIVLEARALFDRPIYVSVDDPKYKELLKIAGATDEFFPKHILGEEIARWSMSIFSASFLSRINDTDNLVIMEFPMGLHYDFAGKSIRESRIREMTGATVIGLWQDGFFKLIESPEDVMTRESIIVAAGTEEQLYRLSEKMHTRPRKINSGREKFIIAGHGVAARKAIQILKENEKDITIIVKEEHDDPAFVTGDITSRETLREAGIMEASTYIVSVNEDDDAIFSILAARHENPDIRIIARVNSHQNIAKLYRAGADFVLSFSKVGAKMIVNKLIGVHKMDIPRLNIQFFDHPVGPLLADKSISDSEIFTRTGFIVIAVKRSGEVIPNPSSDTVLKEGDELILLGNSSDTDIQRTDKLTTLI